MQGGASSSTDPAPKSASGPTDLDTVAKPPQATTKRQKRQARQQKTQNRFRTMVADPSEARPCSQRVRAVLSCEMLH